MEANFEAELAFATQTANQNATQLANLLAQLAAQVKEEFDGRRTEYLHAIHNLPRNADFGTALSNLTIVYTDYFRRVTRKLENVISPRNLSYERNDFLVDFHAKLLGESDKKHYSSLFGAICKYDNKTNAEMNHYADPRFCSYIITKTYKKTYNEVTDFLPLVMSDPLQLVNSNPIRIASIGGGPGNDGLAIADFLRERFPDNVKIFVDVFDLHCASWETANRKPIDDLYKNSAIGIHWKYINHLESDSTEIRNYDFISACWTLNEHLSFNADFWTGLVRGNLTARFLVIEGEKKNIEKLHHIFLAEGFDDVYFEKMANPRRLFARQKPEAPLGIPDLLAAP